jgi:putative nucleotidyltransferase with HDIG domain
MPWVIYTLLAIGLVWLTNRALQRGRAASVPQVAGGALPEVALAPFAPSVSVEELPASRPAIQDDGQAESFLPPVRKAAWTPAVPDAQQKASLSVLIEQFPPLSHTVDQILAEVGACDCRPQRVSQLVSQDPMLVLEVLRYANSASAAQVEPVTSVQTAILLLGFDSIVAIAMRSTMSALMGRAKEGGFDQTAMLRHNLATGLMAGAIARRVPRVSAGEATTVAMLHDIGKIVFNITDPKRVKELLDPHGAKLGESRLAQEERLFGMTHAVAGALLAERWKLPPPLINAIALHHHPAVESLQAYPPRERDLTAVVFVANQLAKYANCPGDDIEVDIASAELFGILGLPPSFEECYARIFPEVESKLITLCDLKPQKQAAPAA